jgi:hypothetical protein
MSEPVIMKIVLKDGRYSVHFREKKGLDEKQIVFTSNEKPDPDLPMALQDLQAGVREICEFPENWCRDRIEVTGVSWSLSDGTNVRGACIIARVDIEAADAPLNIVTPHLPFEQYSKGGCSPLMPEDVQAMLDTLEIEAMAFVSGEKRQQLAFNLQEAA